MTVGYRLLHRLGPTVKFLREHLEKSGCHVGDGFIKAVECDKKISGGYVRGEGVCTVSCVSSLRSDCVQCFMLFGIRLEGDLKAKNRYISYWKLAL